MTTSQDFFGGHSTKALLPLADGTYLEDQARAQNLGGDQWGIVNETGNYPGQPWLWLYSFWYWRTSPASAPEHRRADRGPGT